jgi:hypothetical protein
MAALNQATRAAVGALQGKFERVENEFRDYRVMQDTKFQALIDSNERLTQAVLRLSNPVDDGGHGGPPPPPPPPQYPPNNQPDFGRDESEDEEGGGRMEEEKEEEDVGAPAQPAAGAAVQPPIDRRRDNQQLSLGRQAERMYREQAQRDATQVIQGMAVQPPLKQKKCPGTWFGCLVDWRGNLLEYWVEKARAGWDPKVVRSFNKRLSIQREIRRFRDLENDEGEASAPLCTLDMAAKQLDRLRKQAALNLTNHHSQLSKANSVVGSRKRKTNDLCLPTPRTPLPRQAPERSTPARGVAGFQAQLRQQANRRRQQQLPQPRPAPLVDDNPFFTQFPARGLQLTPEIVEREQLLSLERRRQQAQDEGDAVAEAYRQRTSGVLQWSTPRGRDDTNHGDTGRRDTRDFMARLDDLI